MRVLITGASGFIGSHVTRRALAAGAEVSVLLRPGSDRRRLDDMLPALRVLDGDVRDVGAMEAALRDIRPSLCLHLAWRMDSPDASGHFESLRASLELVALLGRLGCARVLSAGSCAEYAGGPGAIAEDGAVRPQTSYGVCKHALFVSGGVLGRTLGFSFAAVRIFHVYGPQEDPRRLVPDVVRHLLAGEPVSLTSGEQVRDYLHVDDVADGLWRAGADPDLRGAVNVASSVPVRVGDVARTIAAELGRPELLHFGERPQRTEEPPVLYGDAALLRARTGWAPRFGLDEGLRQTIAWWRDRR
jgi:nucleoside-diphosphate-sugar epimerase